MKDNMPINNDELTALQEKIWHVIRPPNSQESNMNSAWELRKNDIIKLGRIKFWVKDINVAVSQEDNLFSSQIKEVSQTFKNYKEIE